MNELDKEQTEVNRDTGIKLAVDNACEKECGWLDEAIKYIAKYPFDTFMTEELRIWSHTNGLPYPPNSRAWGGVVKVAKGKGLIRHIEYNNVRNPKAHGTPASVWEKIGK